MADREVVQFLNDIFLTKKLFEARDWDFDKFFSNKTDDTEFTNGDKYVEESINESKTPYSMQNRHGRHLFYNDTFKLFPFGKRKFIKSSK